MFRTDIFKNLVSKQKVLYDQSCIVFSCLSSQSNTIHCRSSFGRSGYLRVGLNYKYCIFVSINHHHHHSPLPQKMTRLNETKKTKKKKRGDLVDSSSINEGNPKQLNVEWCKKTKIKGSKWKQANLIRCPSLKRCVELFDETKRIQKTLQVPSGCRTAKKWGKKPLKGNYYSVNVAENEQRQWHEQKREVKSVLECRLS